MGHQKQRSPKSFVFSLHHNFGVPQGSIYGPTSCLDSGVDKHPEKRMKAAYEEFENRRLPQLKKENPNMR